MDKHQALMNLIRTFPSAVLAFSGGVDSTLLAVVAGDVLKDKFLAVTAVSPTYPEDQLDEARQLAKKYNLRHQVIFTNEFELPEFVSNPPDRCYYCKSALFEELRKLADEKGYTVILDGANLDDNQDFRPGHRAAREMGVRSPFQEVGMTKVDIRELSKALDIPTWNKPAYACLASRIPYGSSITPEILKRIGEAESFLASLGFREFRVRDHFPVARIEVSPAELDSAWHQKKAVSQKLHQLGYSFVTLDLDGFRSGSMNETLKLDSLGK